MADEAQDKSSDISSKIMTMNENRSSLYPFFVAYN